jgi:hypothetical protein
VEAHPIRDTAHNRAYGRIVIGDQQSWSCLRRAVSVTGPVIVRLTPVSPVSRMARTLRNKVAGVNGFGRNSAPIGGD